MDPRLEELGTEENRLLYLAEETLVARCMGRYGFKFVISAPATDEFEEHPYGNDDVAARRRNGYGSRAPSPEGTGGASASDPNAPYIATLSPAQQSRFQHTLLGPPGAKRADVTLADGNTISFGLEGCAATARGELYGNAKRYMTLLGLVENLATEIQNRVVEDDRYIDAVKAWSECMRKRGFPYKRPGEASAAAAELSRDKEIEIAVADATCARAQKLVGTGKRLERIRRAEVYQDNEGRILGYREMQRAAIEKAKRIVARG